MCVNLGNRLKGLFNVAKLSKPLLKDLRHIIVYELIVKRNTNILLQLPLEQEILLKHVKFSPSVNNLLEMPVKVKSTLNWAASTSYKTALNTTAIEQKLSPPQRLPILREIFEFFPLPRPKASSNNLLWQLNVPLNLTS